MNFEDRLEVAHLGEVLVADWFKSQGCGIVPSYDYSGSNGDKAPRLMFQSRGLVIPDLDACLRIRGAAKRFWCEVKTYYWAPPNHRLGEAPVHGISARLYQNYTQVELETGTPVFVSVLEISTGVLLGALLHDLEINPCTCSGCRQDLSGGMCHVRTVSGGIKAGVYWKRSQMSHWHQFSDDEMAELRTRHPVPNGYKKN